MKTGRGRFWKCIVLASLCLVLVSSVAYAAYYKLYYKDWWGRLFAGTDYVEVWNYGAWGGPPSTATATGWQHCYDGMPGCHSASATLYRNGTFAATRILPSDGGLTGLRPGHQVDVSASSWEAGYWDGILWHYVEQYPEWGPDWDSQTTYIRWCTGTGYSGSSDGLTATHPDSLVRLGLLSDQSGFNRDSRGETWWYAVDLQPSYGTMNMAKSDRGALALLYHAKLQPTELSVGDYFPFLLLNESGESVKAVFPKATGEIRVLNLRLSDEGWMVVEIGTIK